MQRFFHPPVDQWERLLKRPTANLTEIEPLVAEVFSAVRKKGDLAVKKYTEKFDKVQISSLEVNQAELKQAQNEISPDLQRSIQSAKRNIEAFHKAQKTSKVQVETQPGVLCWQEKRPIEKVGLYVPGGSAPLFSTLLMLAIPAQIAGCREIILCTPPNSSGIIPAVIRYTASLCGIQKIFKVGGIQSIAAMTFGTESIPSVYKIFGPGNQYVTLAKQWATRYHVSIDMPAGPSELLVMADKSADVDFIAADLLSQAEHGPDSQVIFVTTEPSLLDKVQNAIEDQLMTLPRRSIAEKALEHSKLICLPTSELAQNFINAYGPEHYILCVEDESEYLLNLHNAGSVFIGKYTPESAGDYASGTNHTLPTNGYSKQYSGVNLDSFTKSITFQKISEKGIKGLGETIMHMASAEGLQAHKNAVSIRLKKISDGL